jgi:predicted permease
MIDALWQDIRYAARSLVRRPLVTAVAVLSLALGIGVNAAIFSAFDGLVFRRLSVPAADQIVLLTSPGPHPGSNSSGDAGGPEAIFSYALVRDLERLTQSGLSAIAAHCEFPANLAYRGQTVSGGGEFVSGAYFPLLGITPALGRLLTPDDDRTPGAHPVVVLSHRYWSSRFGSNPSIVGETLIINGQSMTIIGVAPDGFTGMTLMTSPQVFVPLTMADALRPGWKGRERRNDHWLYLIGRLAPGMMREGAQARLRVPFETIIREVEYPAQRSGLGSDRSRAEFQARTILLHDGSRGRHSARDEIAQAIVLLFAVTGFVLLIACANVANLLLARAADRSTEIALRLSVGASTRRLLQLLMTEACLLGMAGGVVAIAVCSATMRLMMALPGGDPGEEVDLTVDARVLLFTLTLGLATALLFGLFPAVQGARAGTAVRLQEQSARTSVSRRGSRLRAALAATQIALATALLAQSGLLIVSLSNLARVDLGIRAEGLLTFSISPYLNGYTTTQSVALFDQVEDSIRGLPGVVSVTQSTVPLISDSASTRNVTVQDFDAGPDADTTASYSSVGTEYFKTLGIPLLQGREFTRGDTGSRVTAAIVNEAFARKFKLTGHVVGTRMALGAGNRKSLDVEIVGLSRDAHYSQVRQPAPPQFVMPFRQTPGAPSSGPGSITFYVRTTGDPRQLLASIAATVARADRNLPVDNLRTMSDQVWNNVSEDRAVATLATSFAALATLLAGIGLYAMLAYSVARRIREIGIRVAFGARSADVRRLVFGHVARITLSGGVIGLGIALGLGRLGESMLFGLSGTQPGIIGAAALVVVVVASLAGVVPAHRATRVNPVEALRAE